MNVLFLDIDGVLNGYYSKERCFGFCFVEDDKIELLKKFVEKYDFKIVLTSTWRHGWIYKDKLLSDENFKVDEDMLTEIKLFDALVDKFNEFGLSFYDKTDMIDKIQRGVEIGAWLEGRKDVDKIIIFEDEKMVKPYGKYLVKTPMMEGLKEKHIRKAEKMLEEQASMK